MHRTIRRLTVAIAVGMALYLFAAAPALAATATTEPATQVHEKSAVLNGVIDTGGEATIWQFQWGTTAHYTQRTTTQQIAAGNGTVSVSVHLTGLEPRTTYHFRLVAAAGTGSVYYPLAATFGRDLTFKTKATGTLKLLSHRLTVINNFVSVPLLCNSGLKCHGRFNIGARARVQGTHTFANVLCVTTFFTIRAHRKGTIRVRVHGGCLELLRSSPDHSRTAKLTSNPRTGQKALITKVVLVLG